MKYSFRFVCQGGGLDVSSAFLAASLKNYLQCSNELIACIPQGKGYTTPNPKIIAFLQNLGVRLERIHNPFGSDYKIGNKLACINLWSECKFRIFLDSDILCLRPFYGFPGNLDVDLLAKLEDWNHHSNEEWTRLYDFLHLGPPAMAFRSTVLNEIMPLYFNAGVLVINNHSSLPQEWIKLALHIEEKVNLPRKRPNLDQLSLAALVLMKKYSYRLLDERYNYPAALRSINHTNAPFFCHYHDPIMILADEFLTGSLARLCQVHSDLKEISSEPHHWHWNLASRTKCTPMYS